MKKRIFSLLLVLAMIAVLPLGVLASRSEPVADDVYDGWNDTPLLVIKINYTPDNGNNTLIKTTDDTYWSKILFDKTYTKSLWNFYDIASSGRFHFTPAQENYVNADHQNKANDGIVEVSIKYDHSGESNITSSNDRNLAVAAAAEFVDFKVFDTNNNNAIEKGELAIAFVCAGLEATRAGTSAKPSVHAFQSNGSMYLSSEKGGFSFSCGFIKCGEMMNSETPLTVGTFCHELGHYLGTYDLYVSKNWGGANSPAGGVSVMAAGGAGSAGKNSNENTGTSPSNLDAFHIVDQGWAIPTVMTDGEYTLYSRQSTKGEYQIYKIETLNPNEFYLIENRYFDKDNEYFDSDANWNGTRGILIWHVDYNAIATSSGLTANNGSEIGVAALAPRRDAATPNNPASSGVFSTAGQVFDCRDYLFPGSMTWTTSMTDGQGEHLQLKIEILDDAGHEMRIKVSGTTTKVAPETSETFGKTASTITMTGEVEDLYGRTLESVRVLMSSKEDMSDATTYDVTLDDKNSYMLAFDGLKEKTTYYFQAIYTTNEGEMPTNVSSVTTKSASLDTTHYTISFYRGLTSPDKPYNQKVSVGQSVTVKFPMKKEGYVFGGWYLDANYKQAFDLSKGKDDNEDIILYAKWISEEYLVTVNLVGATREDGAKLYYETAGAALTEPTPAAKEGYVFGGWYVDEALTTPFDFEGEQVAGEITMYAKWTEEVVETTTEATQPETEASEETHEMTTEAGGDSEPTEKRSVPSVGLLLGIAAALAVLVVVMLILLKKTKNEIRAGIKTK